MSIGSTTYDVQGGYPGGFGGGYGGLGGLGLVGLIGINSLFGQNNWGGNWGAGGFGGPFGAAAGVAGATVADQNISDLRKDVADVNTSIQGLGNELAASQAQQTLGQTQAFANLNDRLCDSEKTTLAGFYSIQTQGLMNTQAIKDQLTAQQIINQENFCQIKSAINADGDATRALINTIEMQNLRDALELERRGRQFREVEINVTQTNQQTQNQLQAQLQSQSQAIGNALNMLGDQINRQTNSMINLGTMTGNTQAATAANTKVNS